MTVSYHWFQPRGTIIIWELVKNAHSWALPQNYWLGNPGAGPGRSHLTSSANSSRQADIWEPPTPLTPGLHNHCLRVPRLFKTLLYCWGNTTTIKIFWKITHFILLGSLPVFVDSYTFFTRMTLFGDLLYCPFFIYIISTFFPHCFITFMLVTFNDCKTLPSCDQLYVLDRPAPRRLATCCFSRQKSPACPERSASGAFHVIPRQLDVWPSKESMRHAKGQGNKWSGEKKPTSEPDSDTAQAVEVTSRVFRVTVTNRWRASLKRQHSRTDGCVSQEMKALRKK